MVGASVQPAFADDLGARQANMRQQLAAAAAEISQLNLQVAALERSLNDTQQRIQHERAQVRMLARALYAQPDSLVATVFESASISEALTRIADLTSAGDRAASTKRELDRDVSALSRQRAQLQTDRDRQMQLQQQLESQYGKLVQQAAALRVQSPAPPAPPLPTDPGSVGAIQQIILNAFAPLGSAAQTWALRVAKCESNYNPYAVNRSSGASGLFQFLPSTWASLPQHNQSVFDPTANAQAAATLYVRSGPSQWSCQ
jgi:soluble lytic murein transglycosylase-like protein